MQVNVTEGRFFTAQYDPPLTLFHRHNEVWFIPKPDNASSADTALSSPLADNINGVLGTFEVEAS